MATDLKSKVRETVGSVRQATKDITDTLKENGGVKQLARDAIAETVTYINTPGTAGYKAKERLYDAKDKAAEKAAVIVDSALEAATDTEYALRETVVGTIDAALEIKDRTRDAAFNALDRVSAAADTLADRVGDYAPTNERRIRVGRSTYRIPSRSREEIANVESYLRTTARKLPGGLYDRTEALNIIASQRITNDMDFANAWVSSGKDDKLLNYLK